MRDETTREALKSVWCSAPFPNGVNEGLLAPSLLSGVRSRLFYVHVTNVMSSYFFQLNFICIALLTKDTDTKQRYRNTCTAHCPLDVVREIGSSRGFDTNLILLSLECCLLYAKCICIIKSIIKVLFIFYILFTVSWIWLFLFRVFC